MSVHFSSKSDDWATPEAIYQELNLEFGFNLDPCANSKNAKCENYFDKDWDGLKQNWAPYKRVFMNPPYGRVIGKWMKKAWEESQKGAIVVCLIPSRTDTAWWHDYAMKGEQRFIRGRLKFGGTQNSAPFPSAVIVFRPPTP